MGNVNYIKGLYGPVRVSYPLAFSPSGRIDPTTGHALSAYAVIGGAGYDTTYPEVSSLASARFIEWNLKTTNTGSGEVYGEYMSLQSGGTGTGYVYTKGALAKSVTGGYVAELGACYYKSQLTAGTVTGQSYVGFFEYVVDTGVANMPSGGVIQLVDVVSGSLNAVHGYISIRTYGSTPFSNLFNIADHTTGAGKLFYGSTLKNRIGTTSYYIPLSTVENTFTFSGTTTLTGNVTFGTDGTGIDVRFNSANAGRFILWDANGDTDGALYLGADTEGILTQWYGDTTGYYVKFDPSGDTNGAWYFGADTKGIMVNLYGDTTGCGIFWNPTTDTNGTLSIGASGGSKGNDVFMYGATNGNYLQWNQNANELLLVGAASAFDVAGTEASSSTTTGAITTAGGLGVVGAAFIGGLVTSVSTTGFRSNPTFVPDSTYTNYAFSVGNKVAELTVNFAQSTGQNFNPIQAIVNCTATGTGPTDSSQTNLFFGQLTHDTHDMTFLRLKCADFTTIVGKDVKDAYAYQGEVDFTASGITVGGEAAVLGLVMNAGANAVTGNLRGLIISMQGAGSYASVVGLEIRTTCGDVLGHGCSEAIRIAGTPLPVVGIAMGNQTTDNEGPQYAFFFPSTGSPDTGPWSATNASGDAGKIAIKIGTGIRYINVYTS